MTDTMRWVAESLLGWKHHPPVPSNPRECWTYGEDGYERDLHVLHSWHGIGLVMTEMKKQPTEVREEFYNRLEAGGDWWFRHDVSDFIFYHARGAVVRKSAREAVEEAE